MIALRRRRQVPTNLILPRLRTFPGLVAAVLLAACGRPAPTAAPSPVSLEAATQQAAAKYPADGYFTNEFLRETATADAPDAATPTPQRVRIAMPWILNDEGALWYVAVGQGFFRDAGIDAELVPGGPGKDPLALLVGGSVEIAVPPAGSNVCRLVTSPTGARVVAIAALLKKTPYAWIALDQGVPASQRSSRQVQLHEVLDKFIGLQQGDERYGRFVAARLNVPFERLKIRTVGFTPDPLVAGAVDFYAAFINNQPRLLEQQGYRNWIALPFESIGWTEYADVSVVTRETAERKPDLVRRYARALNRAVRFYLDHPAETAAITVRESKDATLTPEMVMRRFELERPLVTGDDGTPPLQMRAEAWNRILATLIQDGEVGGP